MNRKIFTINTSPVEIFVLKRYFRANCDSHSEIGQMQKTTPERLSTNTLVLSVFLLVLSTYECKKRLRITTEDGTKLS